MGSIVLYYLACIGVLIRVESGGGGGGFNGGGIRTGDGLNGLKSPDVRLTGEVGGLGVGGGLGLGGWGVCVQEVGMLLLQQWRVVCHRLASFESSAHQDCVAWGGIGSNAQIGANSATSKLPSSQSPSHTPLHTPSHTPLHTPLHTPFDINNTHTLPPMYSQIWLSYLSSRLLYMWSLNVKHLVGGEVVWATSDALSCMVTTHPLNTHTLP